MISSGRTDGQCPDISESLTLRQHDLCDPRGKGHGETGMRKDTSDGRAMGVRMEREEMTECEGKVGKIDALASCNV